ncbi:ABC transporter substrate-binding protein [Aquibacillus kalidii]|uniref:ABC transporter substrate-binding protein n=1 Tax=Aquibacillus kalidii TaxID=2762597 RepID=UPI0016473933|nr:ABC transporter substrate-binding protein [Aquibacillus kalidii]
MKKFTIISIILVMAVALIVYARTLGEEESPNKVGTAEEKKEILKASWNEVLSQAKGKKVNIYMWGGDESTNRYIDEWVAPRIMKKLEIKLNRVPVKDINDTINKLLTEKQVGKDTGSIDIMWINGENFLTAKQNNLLWGSFSSKLPNANKYIDLQSPAIKNDFGEPTNGLEAPWSQAQFVFTYDKAKVLDPPKSAEELKAWVKQNPGKFTYPAPPDFTGSAFIRNILYETTGGYKQYERPISEQTQLEEKMKPLWAYLNEIKPYLWRKGETYPESSSKLDKLYADGAVWMTMSYDPSHAANEVNNGNFPKSTRTFVLEKGTLSNTSYLTIPFNSPNKAAAMAVINFMQSPTAQIAKADPSIWGAMMVIDPTKLNSKQKEKYNEINRGESSLPVKELMNHRVPEIPAEYVDFIEKGWKEYVAKE